MQLEIVVAANMYRKDIVKELHAPVRKRFPRCKTVLKGIGDLWQIDLVEMGKYAKENKKFKYILTAIDCFSKFAWAKPVLNKTSGVVAKAMEQILLENDRAPRNLQSDNGKEFYNKVFQSLMQTYKINHYSTYTHMKASIVERFNRTLKEKMWKLFSLQGSYVWIDKLDLLLNDYNNTIHRTIKMRPTEVTKRNEKRLLKTVFAQKRKLMKNKFNIGDHVRISKYKTIFEKGYTPNWSTEIFRITHVNNKHPITYLLKDYTNQPIAGRFYEKELQRVKHPDTYLVEKVLRRRGDRVYVKWLGFDHTHNSWIDGNNIL